MSVRSEYRAVLAESLNQKLDRELLLSVMTSEERTAFEALERELLNEVAETDSWEPLLRRVKEGAK